MRRFLPLAAYLSLGFSPLPFPKPPRQAAPLPLIEGAWRSDRPMLVTATRLTFGGPADAPYGTITLGRAARPAAFDLVSQQAGGPTWLGIYKVEGDKLTICYSLAADGRPTAFDCPGKGRITEVFRRVK